MTKQSLSLADVSLDFIVAGGYMTFQEFLEANHQDYADLLLKPALLRAAIEGFGMASRTMGVQDEAARHKRRSEDR